MWFSEMFDFTRFFTLMVENCEWDQMEKWIETRMWSHGLAWNLEWRKKFVIIFMSGLTGFFIRVEEIQLMCIFKLWWIVVFHFTILLVVSCYFLWGYLLESLYICDGNDTIQCENIRSEKTPSVVSTPWERKWRYMSFINEK